MRLLSAQLGLHGVLVVVHLGVALISQKLELNLSQISRCAVSNYMMHAFRATYPAGGNVAMQLGLLDPVAVVLLVLVVVRVVLGLGHLSPHARCRRAPQSVFCLHNCTRRVAAFGPAARSPPDRPPTSTATTPLGLAVSVHRILSARALARSPTRFRRTKV